MNTDIRIIPVHTIPEVKRGDNLPQVILYALSQQHLILGDRDIIVVTQKIVSKAEGNIVNLRTIKPSTFAQTIAKTSKKTPSYMEVVLQESTRIVRMDRGVLIAQTHHGFICANAGVDESNMYDTHTVSLLPINPDKTATKVQEELQKTMKQNTHLGVIISDTWGRPWREGQVNIAIGVAGLEAVIDYRGKKDPYGYDMHASMIAVADELAGAAELVMGKVNMIPVAIIRGYQFTPSTHTGQTLLRNPTTDMFR